MRLVYKKGFAERVDELLDGWDVGREIGYIHLTKDEGLEWYRTLRPIGFFSVPSYKGFVGEVNRGARLIEGHKVIIEE